MAQVRAFAGRNLGSAVWRWLCRALVLAGLFVAAAKADPAQSPAQNPAPGTGKIAVFLSSDGNHCFTPGITHAIRHFTSRYVDFRNRRGGIAGREIEVVYYDDFENAETATQNVKAAISDPDMLAMVGIPSSTRGDVVFKVLGPELREKAIPFITEISLDTMFRDQPSVFTMASSVRNELEVVRKVIAEGGYQRPVFVGLDDDLYSRALGDGLKETPGAVPLIGTHSAPVKNYQITDDEAEALATAIAAQNPDLVLLAINSAPSATLLGKLAEHGLEPPVFVLLGRIASIARSPKVKGYAGAMSQIAREGVPNVYNERLRRWIWRAPDRRWVFDDTRNDDAPGWQDGTCDPRPDQPPRKVFDAANSRAVGRGSQYRDMIQMIADAAQSAPSGADTAALRAHIGETLRGFTEGRHVMKGLWRDWTFTADRTAAEDILILSKQPESDAIVLAPKQYRRIAGQLLPSTTVYTSIDLISLSRIDTNDRSFDAEFYLSMRSDGNRIGIDNIEFTNAYRSQAGAGRLMTFHEIHDGLASSNFPAGVRLYKVSGKFEFEPNLGAYPFDTQRLSVSFQPANAAEPFLIQPTAPSADAGEVNVDGWELKEDYVGSDQDIVPTLGKESERRVVPFYKFNDTWIVSRLAVDYYLRVVIPLAFILLVTYFSVFLPHARFESVMGIQVTALLSSIALYLALPKVDTDQATLSDKIFMMTYAAVSLMIGLSILKDNLYGTRLHRLNWVVAFIQRIVFPAATIGAVLYLLPSTQGEAQNIADALTSFWQSFTG